MVPERRGQHRVLAAVSALILGVRFCVVRHCRLSAAIREFHPRRTTKLSSGGGRVSLNTGKTYMPPPSAAAFGSAGSLQRSC